jgi:hypothetical protein
LENQNIIFNKLEAFIRKYYINELLRGILFFVGLGLLYFLFTVFVEYFLWLQPTARTILFGFFIIVELFLLGRYILYPLSKLFKLQKGIGLKEASIIVGNHFSEVGDTLTNFLQLADNPNKSELLLASIDQKAKNLQPIPFASAVNFNANKKYFPIVLIPVLIVSFLILSGKSSLLSQSFNRVVNYQKQFAPPAPFQFQIVNPSLQSEQNKDFTVLVKTVGSVVPENVMLLVNGQSYFMETNRMGEFQYTFEKLSSTTDFHLEANNVNSKDYQVQVISVPSIANFDMVLDYPNYLNRKSETIKGSGNAIIPEGTKVTWKMNTVATKKVDMEFNGQKVSFGGTNNQFSIFKVITDNFDYTVLTSNDKVSNYEKLNYQLVVNKDQFPTISVTNAPDSLKVEKNYILGQVSDDYKLSKLQIVYYPKNNPKKSKRANLNVKNDSYDQFVFAFPSNLSVVEGVSYDYYFEVFDNDVLHNFKSSKSTIFSNKIATQTEKEDQLLQEQSDNINSLKKSLNSQEKQFNELDKLRKLGKETESLEFKEQQKVNDFINKQKQQEQLMKQFAEKMKENLDKERSDKKDETKEILKDRLEKVDKEFDKNKKLLEELEKLNSKLEKEELFEKMDKLKQQFKNQTKTLEQLVELTKRYYVEKKAEQVADKLEKLAEKQEKLANNEKENSAEKQEEINKEFDKIQEELKQLQEDNNDLKSPMDIPDSKAEEKSIDEDLKKAKEELSKQSKAAAKPKQKSAAKKMQEMSGKMQESMDSGESDQLEEDVVMLRQILDNLLAYSFSQEDLMKQFKNLKRNSPSFNKNLKIQQDLKQQFKHIDDSLFAMSLRNPKIAEEVTTEIGNVQYNVDSAIETLADANVFKGVSHQQYATASANKLADMLASILTNMQMSLSMQGSGKGKGKPKPGQGSGGGQLPDIIQKQESLSDKMKDGMKSGDKPGEKPGKKPGEKPGGKDGKGKDGKDGKGKDGKDGKDGKEGTGSSGSGSNSDSQGENGENNAKEIMEIYKQQKELRDQLQDELNKNGIGSQGKNVLDQMKEIEKQIINKGFNNESLQRMLNLKYELLKLDKAIQQQGEEKKRQAETNTKQYNNNANALPKRLQDYLNNVEILNRQTLPLRPNFNQKVQEYFKK